MYFIAFIASLSVENMPMLINVSVPPSPIFASSGFPINLAGIGNPILPAAPSALERRILNFPIKSFSIIYLRSIYLYALVLFDLPRSLIYDFPSCGCCSKNASGILSKHLTQPYFQFLRLVCPIHFQSPKKLCRKTIATS